MTDNPKDPAKPGARPGSGTSAGKRPAATIDLKATEIERRDIPSQDASEPSGPSNSTQETMGTWASMGDPQQPLGADESASAPKSADPAAAQTPRAAADRNRNRFLSGGFFSHMLAGVAGAGIAIFGADYLANTVGLSLPTYSAAQVDQLTRRIGTLEQDAKEHNGDAAAARLREQLDALQAKVEQTAAATATLGGVQSAQQELAGRATKLEQSLSAQPPGPEIASRLGKLEDQFKMLAQAGASGQAGNTGTMAALIAKVDGMGANLDTHLAEMRRSLQTDIQKQSSHFEERLSEVDKGMAVDTLKASGKTLSDQIVGLRADGDKLHQDVATIAAGNDALRKDLAALQQTTTDLKAQVQGEAATFAKSQQLTDVNATAAKLQSDVASIAARDQSREQGANRILLTLELANLKRAVERGGGYAKELGEVKRLAPKGLDLTALDAGADKGLPTNALLASEFKDLTWNILNADGKPSGDGSLLGELWQGARSVVQVRRTGEVAGDSTDAVLARTEARLQSGDLEGGFREIAQLKGDARKAAEPWTAKLAGRLSVDQAIAEVETGLAKLMGPGGATTAPTTN